MTTTDEHDPEWFPEAKKVEWRGILFDSVLEADWAASLFAWGVDFEHHPGSLDLGDGRRYEPDFLLPNGGHWGQDVLLEVKGWHDLNLDKAHQLQADNPGKTVIIGRPAYIIGEDHGEYGAARWEPSDYQFEIYGERFISGELVDEQGLPGLKMFRANRGTDKVD